MHRQGDNSYRMHLCLSHVLNENAAAPDRRGPHGRRAQRRGSVATSLRGVEEAITEPKRKDIGRRLAGHVGRLMEGFLKIFHQQASNLVRLTYQVRPDIEGTGNGSTEDYGQF